MLGWRLSISAVLVPLLVLIFYFDHHAGPRAPWLLAFCLLLALRGTWEMCTLLRTRSFEPSFPAVAVCTAAVVAAAWIVPATVPATTARGLETLGPPMLAYSLSILVLFLTGAVRYRAPGRSMETLGAELLTVSYLGVLIAVTVQLRWVAGPDAGYLALGSLVIAAKCGDIGGYTLGRLFGRKKLVPTLSPGKTWMGGWGALLGAGLGAWAWLEFATPMFNPIWQSCPWYLAVAYGVIIGLVGLIGDLCESLIKRDVQQKDSAPLLPGFGGLLDLLDSVLYAGPVAYLLWLVLPLVEQ
jgi:phosphatidate cytidylyltransferase